MIERTYSMKKEQKNLWDLFDGLTYRDVWGTLEIQNNYDEIIACVANMWDDNGDMSDQDKDYCLVGVYDSYEELVNEYIHSIEEFSDLRKYLHFINSENFYNTKMQDKFRLFLCKEKYFLTCDGLKHNFRQIRREKAVKEIMKSLEE